MSDSESSLDEVHHPLPSTQRQSPPIAPEDVALVEAVESDIARCDGNFDRALAERVRQKAMRHLNVDPVVWRHRAGYQRWIARVEFEIKRMRLSLNPLIVSAFASVSFVIAALTVTGSVIYPEQYPPAKRLLLIFASQRPERLHTLWARLANQLSFNVIGATPLHNPECGALDIWFDFYMKDRWGRRSLEIPDLSVPKSDCYRKIRGRLVDGEVFLLGKIDASMVLRGYFVTFAHNVLSNVKLDIKSLGEEEDARRRAVDKSKIRLSGLATIFIKFLRDGEIGATMSLFRINPVLISSDIRKATLGNWVGPEIIRCLVSDLIRNIVFGENIYRAGRPSVGQHDALVACKDILASYVERNGITYWPGWEVGKLRELNLLIVEDFRSKESVLGMTQRPSATIQFLAVRAALAWAVLVTVLVKANMKEIEQLQKRLYDGGLVETGVKGASKLAVTTARNAIPGIGIVTGLAEMAVNAGSAVLNKSRLWETLLKDPTLFRQFDELFEKFSIEVLASALKCSIKDICPQPPPSRMRAGDTAKWPSEREGMEFRDTAIDVFSILIRRDGFNPEADLGFVSLGRSPLNLRGFDPSMSAMQAGTTTGPSHSFDLLGTAIGNQRF